jgi:simple sugar transport system permease protein
MTGGRGFIALAAFYFGDARPGLTALGAVIFGVFEAAGFRLGSSGIPSQLVQMLPYLVVVISLTLVAVRRERRLRQRGRAAAASLPAAVLR